MIFQLESFQKDVSTFPEPVTEETFWTWYLRAGTADKPGQYLARAPQNYLTEEAARSTIALVRKSAGGMKFAKVVNA